MTIQEPMTLATDYLIAIVATIFGISLRRRGSRFWPAAFFATAAAALIGGSYHGFRGYLSQKVADAVWKGTVYAIGFATLFFLLGAAYDLVHRPKLRRAIEIFAFAEFVIYVAWVTVNPDFLYVILDYGSGLLLLGMAAIAGWKRIAAAPWIVASVATSVVGALIQQSGFALHRHFNHNDLYHVVQVAALWMLYRGVTRLSTARSTIQPT